MKKAKIIGKKTLSVLLAVLMVLTAWVWVAPTEASAATAGTYDVQVRIQTTDSVDVGDNKDLTLTLNYKKDNGNGSAGTPKTNNVSYTWANNDNADNTWTITGLDGYPTSFSVYCLYAWTAAIQRVWGCTIYINVKDNDTGTWTEVAKQSFSENGGSWGQTEKTYTISSIGGAPEATRVTFLSGDTSLTIPKTGESNVTKTYTAGVYDQYGVRMTHEPTYYVRSTAPTSAQSSSSTITGVSMSSGTTSGTMTVTSAAQNTSADTKNVYVHAKYGTVYANRTVALNDPPYTFTYNKNTTDSTATISPSSNTSKQYYNTFGDAAISGTRTGFTFKGFYQSAFADSYENAEYSGTPLSSTTRYTADIDWYAAWQANLHTLTFNYKDENNVDQTYTVNDYFGRIYTMPTVPEYAFIKENGVTNYTYQFTGWKVDNTIVTPPTTIPDENVVYTAVYDETTHYADLTALEEQIRLANEKKTEQLYQEGAYTDSTVAVFENMLKTAEELAARKPLLSEQGTVKSIAETLEAARKNLDIKNYTVIFVDEDGTILKDGYFFVPHGATVTVPANPEKAADETNHYIFGGWDTEESDSLDACNHVTDNLIYVASFNKEAHTFTETVTPSTCTTDGVITKTCDCGYSYTVAGETANHKWSTDYKEINPATCATKGAEAKYCTACGAIDESTKRDIAELGHNWGAYTEYTPATCFGEGSEIAECSRCGGKNVRKLAQKTHAYGTSEEIEKTCTTDGYTKEVCTLCGFTNIRDIDKATGHSISETTVHSTCVSSGYTKEECANCDYEKTTILPATGNHTYPETWTKVSDATCVGHGVEKRVCTVCKAATETRLTAFAAHTEPADWTTEKEAWCGLEGRKVKDCTVCGKELAAEAIPALSHNYEAYAEGSYAETCTSAGATAEKCSRCGDIKTTVIQPLGHDWNAGETTAATCTSGAYKTYTCKRNGCGETRVEIINGSTALTHDFTGTETIIKAATCTEDGKKTVKCTRCDVTNEVIIPKLGHNYGEWDKTTNPATNDKDGTWTRECANCHNIETIIIPKGGHNFVEDITKYVAPKCNAKGQRVYKCGAHENCIATVTVELDYAQHTIVKENKEATCTTAGYAKTYCSVCKEVFNSVDIPVKAHNYVAQDAVDATCTTSGYTPYKCENCTSTYNMYDENQPATGHTYESSVTNEPSCTTQGEKTFTCDCGKSYTETIPATGHNYVKGKVTTADCTTAGTEVYTCACGNTYTKFIEAAKGHTYGEWTVVTPATADKNGVQKRICTVCGAEEYGLIAPIGAHEFTATITTHATCTTEGLKTFTCSKHTNCSANYTEKIPATGHKGELKYTAPTCYSEGSTQIVCSVESCKHAITEAIAIPRTAHTYGVQGEVTTPATCTTDGEMTFTCTATNCGATRTEVIEKSGHDLTTKVNHPTCGEKGSVVTTCANCDDPTVEKTTELAAKGHIWNDGVVTTPATCTNGGEKTYTCTICGETKTEDIDALGHNWGEWTVTPSTNNDTGSVSRECLADGCDETETVVIPAGAHNLVEASREDASCTKPGSVTYTCNVTHEGNVKCGISVTVPLAMTQHKLETTKTDAKCEANGEVVTKCKNCDATTIVTIIPAKGHSIKAIVTEATCTTAGSVIEKCTADGCDYEKIVKSLPALGHDFSGEESDVKDATCTADGSKTVKCTRCDKTTTVIIPKRGHTWGRWEVVTEATNTVDGEWMRTCSNGICTETLKIPAGGHTFDRITPDSKTDATCTTEGSATYKCKTEGHTCGVEITVTIPVTPHSIAQREILATCKVEGKVEAYCLICNDVLSTEIIPVKAHAYTAGAAVAPTCSTSGYTPYTCSCGDSYNKYDETKPATGHTLTQGDSTATCTTAGKMTLTCKNCTYSTAVEVPALGHNYQPDGTTEATCKAAATKTYKCSRCADSYTISVGDKATAHTWGAWEVKESATASSLGYQTSTCSVCGQIKVETIPATGEHNFNTVIDRKDATCTEKGWIEYDCSTHKGADDCKLTSKVELPAIGHTEDIKVEDATCTVDGRAVQYCTTCKKELKEVKLDALGHNWDDGVIINATCKDKGKIEYTCKRTGCGATHETEIAVNLNAHQYETTVVKATCTSAGSVVTKCKLCQNEIENETLAQLNHNWDSGAETTAATCTTEGVKTFKCSLCSTEKTEPIAKSGHNWGEWVKTDATNSKDGEWKRICKTNENHVETLVIPKGGHTFKDEPDSTTPATCTATGTATYNCTAHTGENACGVTITVTLDKLQHELEHTEKQATCDAEGSVITKCKKCDTATYTTVIPATGCVWDKGVVTTPATCTTEGLMTFTCANNASHQHTKTLTKLQHNYVAGTPVAATCTSSGYTPYKCETCELSYVVLGAAAKGHDYSTVVSSTANCGKAGEITLQCACGDTMTTAVPALNHNYVKIGSTDATCAAAATETYKCDNCDASYTVSVGSKSEDHKYIDNWTVVENATEESIGYQTRPCEICGQLEIKTIEATGEHTFTTGEIVESKPASCEENGYEIRKCTKHKDCNKTGEITLPALGHTEELRYTAPSCTSEGSTSIYCTRCKNTIGEEKVLPELDHTYEVESIVNSTCKVEGTITLECKCGATKEEKIPVNADAHELKIVKDLATCKKAGSVTVTCENGCGYKDETAIPMLQHNWGEWTVTTPSTNSNEGEMTRYCGSGCEETVKIPAGGHAFGKEPSSKKPATCTAEGTATYKCTEHANCGVEITVKLDKVQHSLVTDIKEATCTEEGHVRVYCTKCEYDKAVNMTIGKLAHSDKVIETKPATCTTAAYTTYECENCHRAFSKLDAQPSGHRYLNEGAVVVTNATCEIAGYTTYNCDNCDETHTVNLVAAKGHSWTEWTVEKAATNAEKGILSRTCINGCGKKETAEIPAGGHSFNTDEPSATTDGTCLVKGTKTFKCSVHSDCGVTIIVETEFGAHNWSDWTKVDATNDKDGSWKRECAVCHETETHVIPKGNHTFGDKPSSTVPSTCKKAGTATYNCTTHTNCGVTITVVLDMIQHTPKVDKKDASCTEIGYVKTYCEKCNDVISYVELPATGHINTSVVREESTCIKKGTEKVICACGHIVSVKELPFAEHNYEMTYENGVYTYTCKVEGCKHSYTETVETTFTVKFFAADKKTVLKTEAVKSGEAATAPAAPSKGADDNYHYTFSEWDRDFSEITSDLDVYPTYEKEAHYGGAATCTEKAVCDECGTGYGETDASKHVIDTKVTPATCEKDGVLEYYCTENGCTYSKTEVIKKTGHSLGAWETYQNGNCATPTIKIRKCRNNGCKYYEQKESYGSHTWYIQPEVAPTCTTVGYSEYKYCTTCGMEIDSVVIPKLNHRDNDGDGNCDYCTYTEPVLKCSCMCHSTGFMKFIYSIVRFFWIITKSQPACNCGAKHY